MCTSVRLKSAQSVCLPFKGPPGVEPGPDKRHKSAFIHAEHTEAQNHFPDRQSLSIHLAQAISTFNKHAHGVGTYLDRCERDGPPIDKTQCTPVCKLFWSRKQSQAVAREPQAIPLMVSLGMGGPLQKQNQACAPMVEAGRLESWCVMSQRWLESCVMFQHRLVTWRIRATAHLRL